ncbi:hypothetical protein MNB_SM-4-311 [hydrothermal vent metagenome]|uniref:Uncharacterized protein n=1 Tax=hydrothermal vent metagenome TaxID=652676 RepID=A0A1W1BV75_9ZZZZ
MIALKTHSNIQWNDLKHIESPFFARVLLETAFKEQKFTNEIYNILYQRNPMYLSYTPQAKLTKLDEMLNYGELLVLVPTPTQAVVVWDKDKQTYHVQKSLNDTHFELVITNLIYQTPLLEQGYMVSVREPAEQVDTSAFTEPVVGGKDKEDVKDVKVIEIVDIFLDTSTSTIYLLTQKDLDIIKTEEDGLNNALKPVLDIQGKNKDIKEILHAKQTTQKALSDLGIKEISKPIKGKELTEIRRLNGKKFTYIRSEVMKNHFKSYKLIPKDDFKYKAGHSTDGSISLNNILKGEDADLSQFFKEASDSLGKKFKLKHDLSAPDFTKMANVYRGSVTTNYGDAAHAKDGERIFDASSEAQWMRYAAGASVSSSFEIWDKKGDFKGAFAFEGNLDSSFALAEGSTEVTTYFPKEDGKIVSFMMPIKGTQEEKSVSLGKMRVDLKAKLTGFVGASAILNASVGFKAIDIKDGAKALALTATSGAKRIGKDGKDTDAGADGAGELFAGVRGGCDVDAKLQWKNPEKTTEFSPLATTAYGANVSAGFGGLGEFKLRYEKGKFYFRVKAELVCGLGAGGKMAFMVDNNLIVTLAAFVYHQLRKEDFDYLKFIEKDAFALLGSVLIETFTQPSEYVERVYEGLDKLFNEYKDAWKDQSDRQVESKQVAKQIMEEEQEEAIIVILSWIQSKSEARRVFKNIKEESSAEVSEVEGKTKVYKALDGRELFEFAKWQHYWLTTMPEKTEKKEDTMIKQMDLSIF